MNVFLDVNFRRKSFVLLRNFTLTYIHMMCLSYGVFLAPDLFCTVLVKLFIDEDFVHFTFIFIINEIFHRLTMIQ